MTYIFHLITDDTATTHECEDIFGAANELRKFAVEIMGAVSRKTPTPEKISIVIKPKEAVKRDKVS